MSFTMPVGSIIAIWASADSPPPQWLACNGKTFDGNAYPQLAEILPNNTLPNLMGKVLIGAGQGSSGTTYSQGTDYGSKSHTLALDEMPSHQHFGFGESSNDWPYGQTSTTSFMGSHGGTDDGNYLYGSTFAGGTGGDAPIGVSGDGYTFGSKSDNSSFDLLQPSFAMNFFIYAGTY